MNYETLISVDEANDHINDPAWVFADCRFTLGQPDRGREEYLARHIKGAVYLDLEADLSGEIVPGRTGRHPLPSQEDFDAVLSRLGLDAETQVVAYDDQTGAMAGRLWWLLKWAGHDRVAVLDGGFRAWVERGLPCSSGWEERRAKPFTGTYRGAMVADAGDVLAAISSGSAPVLDARAGERYRGENETIDPIAGHIPGARSVPYQGNLDADGHFLSQSELRERFGAVAGSGGSEQPIVYCGSGVTAAHNVLAYAHAGLELPRLYPGSWSEWITDPSRPIATGDE